MLRARGWRGQTEGEYRVVRRWRWARGAAARVYEAFHRRTGAAALLLMPGRRGDWAPARRPWEARVVSTPSALAVELKPGSLRTQEDVQEVTLAFHRLTAALSQVEDVHVARSALVGEVARNRVARARHSIRPVYAALGLAAAVIALLAAPRAGPSARHSDGGDATSVQLAPAASLEEPAGVARVGPEVLARDMPREPFPGQSRPGKDGRCAGRGERVINGACWVRLGDLDAPCDDRSYEHRGACYVPMFPAIKEPASVIP
jgi:hypothetical protein